MTDIKNRLTGAADHLDYLYEGAKHLPADLIHSDERRGLVTTVVTERPVAQFFWGGAAEVFLALGPAALPILARILREEARVTISEAHGENCSDDCVTLDYLRLADHILITKENQA